MRTRRDQREHGGAVWRGDGYPTVAGLQAGVHDQVEAELINVEAQAAVEIVYENADGVNAEEGFRASWLGRGHVPNYKAEDRWQLLQILIANIRRWERP